MQYNADLTHSTCYNVIIRMFIKYDSLIKQKENIRSSFLSVGITQAVLHFDFVLDGCAINAKLYYQQLDRVYYRLKNEYPALIKRGRALFQRLYTLQVWLKRCSNTWMVLWLYNRNHSVPFLLRVAMDYSVQRHASSVTRDSTLLGKWRKPVCSLIFFFVFI